MEGISRHLIFAERDEWSKLFEIQNPVPRNAEADDNEVLINLDEDKSSQENPMKIGAIKHSVQDRVPSIICELGDMLSRAPLSTPTPSTFSETVVQVAGKCARCSGDPTEPESLQVLADPASNLSLHHQALIASQGSFNVCRSSLWSRFEDVEDGH